MMVRTLSTVVRYWGRHWWPKLAFLAAILAVMVIRAKPADIAHSFSQVDARWLAAAAVVDASVIFLKGIDLKIVVDSLGSHRPRVIEAVSATSIGLMVNWLVPARLGEFARAYVLHRSMRRRGAGIRAATLFGCVVGERLFAVVSIVVLLVVFVIAGVSLPGWAKTVLLLGLPALAGVLAALVVYEHARHNRRRARRGCELAHPGGTSA
jgi:hypothetical protein